MSAASGRAWRRRGKARNWPGSARCGWATTRCRRPTGRWWPCCGICCSAALRPSRPTVSHPRQQLQVRPRAETLVGRGLDAVGRDPALLVVVQAPAILLHQWRSAPAGVRLGEEGFPRLRPRLDARPADGPLEPQVIAREPVPEERREAV